jgi:hypothetical protein
MEIDEKEFNEKRALGAIRLKDAKEAYGRVLIPRLNQECKIAIDAGDTLLEACKKAEIVIENLKRRDGDNKRITKQYIDKIIDVEANNPVSEKEYLDKIIRLKEKNKTLEAKNLDLEEKNIELEEIILNHSIEIGDLKKKIINYSKEEIHNLETMKHEQNKERINNLKRRIDDLNSTVLKKQKTENKK